MAYGDNVVSRECASSYAEGWETYGEELSNSGGNREEAYRGSMERAERHRNERSSEQFSCERVGIQDRDQNAEYGTSLGLESCGY